MSYGEERQLARIMLNGIQRTGGNMIMIMHAMSSTLTLSFFAFDRLFSPFLAPKTPAHYFIYLKI